LSDLFPPIEFDPQYTQKDRNITTFIVHSCIREYQKALSPFFFSRYGFQFAIVTMFDVKGLVQNADGIIHAIKSGTAPKGIHAYWST
jgi:hypothetical protein